MSNENHIDIAIIGGGIIGLSIAYELSQHEQFSNLMIAIFEQENFCGDHQSGRNSGVLHAGIYYPKNSLKERHCIAGNRLWREWAKKLDVPLLPCGKYIVASSGDELERFNEIKNQAIENGVPLEEASLDHLREHLNVVQAFYSPTSCIIDVSKALKALEDYLYNCSIPVIKNTKIENIKKNGDFFSFDAGSDLITSKWLINAGGPFAVENRKQLGLTDIEAYWVKGHYLKWKSKQKIDHLIYPVPPKGSLGLGVHITMDIDGNLKFGPDTMPVENIDYTIDEQRIDQMWPAIHRLFKNVKRDELAIDYSGIRSKIKVNGVLQNDFLINGDLIPGYIELLGIESPGLTSSPSLAKHIVKSIY